MLFNSQEFVFVFLPLVWLVFQYLRSTQRWQWLLTWLLAASLFFYGWWDWRYLALILASIGANYWLGLVIAAQRDDRRRGWLCAAGVLANLALLGYYKYAGFLVANWNVLTGIDAVVPQIVLPLGISFFCFQKIAYLVDVRRGEPAEPSLVRFGLFATFFPQLIAGPIVHFKQVMPAFAALPQRRGASLDLAVGLSIFAIGLAKKVLIADRLAPYVGPVFDAEPGSPAPDSLIVWTAVLAYTFQLYFDFSGYSDMAVGLGRMFGIPLPVNFFSPYRAGSITEFWRRWHMTLSAFLRDYVYITLGGNRHGPWRTGVNLFLTMAVGGLWHGANWTFVAWGCWHGAWLVVHRIWSALVPAGWRQRVPAVMGIATTFVIVMLGWVSFRAQDLTHAMALYDAMFAIHATAWPAAFPEGSQQIALAAAIAWLAPNTTQWFARYEPGLVPAAHLPVQPARWAWSPRPGMALVVGVVFLAALLALTRETVFLYFQF
jgi:D-alanyl-lipoteichoic acid acyltransferase DltB (MBOAT superfamily)